MKTTLNHYRYDISKADQKAAYDELRESTLKKIGFPVWAMDMRSGYSGDSAAWKFMDKIRSAAGDIELETEHLFENQWNAAGMRLFHWAECDYLNRNIKEGYWLEQTDEMREILRSTHKCGYCGKQEPATKGYVFCPHCLGSSHLTEDQLPLTRMRPVSDTGRREELTEAERAHLLPIYQEAQLRGQGERSIAAAKAARSKIESEYKSRIDKAEAEYHGFTWILDHGLQVDNVIYYGHTGRFCFGWRQGVSESAEPALLDVLSEFPFPYDIKCADGRTLSGEYAMRTITKQVFAFDELSDSAKENAREWYREGAEFPWGEEYKASINAFVDHFGAELKDWNIGPWSPLDYRVEFDNSNFRGVKLSQFTGEEMPTGFCADCDLWGTFHKAFNGTGDAKLAFESAVRAGFEAWRDGWEYSLSDESTDESIRANEYEFYENGEAA